MERSVRRKHNNLQINASNSKKSQALQSNPIFLKILFKKICGFRKNSNFALANEKHLH